MLERIPKFFSLHQHKRRKNWISTKVLKKSSENFNEVLETKEPDENKEQIQHDLSACQNFSDNTEMENRRHWVFNFKLSKFDPNEKNEKQKKVLEN